MCVSKNLQWYPKPSETLREKLGYKKAQLPRFANELDLHKLRASCRSFREFIEALKTTEVS